MKTARSSAQLQVPATRTSSKRGTAPSQAEKKSYRFRINGVDKDAQGVQDAIKEACNQALSSIIEQARRQAIALAVQRAVENGPCNCSHSEGKSKNQQSPSGVPRRGNNGEKMRAKSSLRVRSGPQSEVHFQPRDWQSHSRREPKHKDGKEKPQRDNQQIRKTLRHRCSGDQD